MNVLVTGARAPISADIARALAGEGHRVWTADCQRFPVGAFSPDIWGHVHLPAPRQNFAAFQQRLVETCQKLAIELVVPTCEEVFWLAAVTGLPSFTRRFCPPLAILGQLHNKHTFSALATSLGYGADQNILLSSRAQVSAFLANHAPEDFVLKPVYSRFASTVLISPDAQAVAQLAVSEELPWLAQTRAWGEEACLYNVAKEGKLLLHTAYRPKWRAGKGAGVYFEPVASNALRKLSAAFIEKTGFTGQISFDVIETAGGPVAIECNPRGTSGVHLAVQNTRQFGRALLGIAAAEDEHYHPVRLGIPLLFYNPSLMWSTEGRAARRRSSEAMRSAGIPLWAQVVATGAMLAKGMLAGQGPLAASTNDIEWNGEVFVDTANTGGGL